MAHEVVDARVLREAMARYLEALRVHREEIDSINVFPVPDGDTGTNLLLTQQAVQEALAGVRSDDVELVGETISRSALMGARGNSGVIMSQVLRGLSAGLGRGGGAGPGDLAHALAVAAREARIAVAEPADGTMLTVLRDAADAAAAASEGSATTDEVAEAALRAAMTSLERTRHQLPALAEAGVVDAGALGVVLFLDALVAALGGTTLPIGVGPGGPVRAGRERSRGAASTFGSEVMYLLACEESAVGPIRERLATIGDSVVVVGGAGLFTVHVHTDDPDRAVKEGVAVGGASDVRVTSLDDQVEACLADEARAVRAGEPRASPGTVVVAIVPTQAAARLFRSMGAAAVVAPSETALTEAVEAAAGWGVLVLANDPVAEGLAERVVAGAGRAARVVAGRTIPEELAAATAVLSDDQLEVNVPRAEAAIRAVTTTVSGPEGVVEAIRAIHRPGHEVATLLAGRGVSDKRADRAAQEIRRALPHLDVEWHRTDQPDHPFVIGLE